MSTWPLPAARLARVRASKTTSAFRLSSPGLTRFVRQRLSRHAPQGLLELSVPTLAELFGVVGFDIREDLVRKLHHLEAPLGGHDQLCATIRRISCAIYVAELLQLVQDGGDGLLVPSGDAGQIHESDALVVQVGEHGAVARPEVVEAVLRSTAK